MQQPELLDNITHKKLRIITSRGVAWGDGHMSCIAVPDEFRKLQAHYPIVFQKNGEGALQPVAMLGLRDGQNLFLKGDRWDAHYIPLAAQHSPFMIGHSGGDLKMLIDMASPRISQGAQGEAVFLPQGGTTEFVEHANSVLATLHAGLLATPDFLSALAAHDLLEPFVLEVEHPDGSMGRLVGYYTVHEERFSALSASTIGVLHEAGFLQPIFMAMASMSNFHDLIVRNNAIEALGHA